MEFSKMMFMGVSIGTILVVLFSCALAWKTSDTSVMSYIVGGVFVELATATGFYYKKAEKENVIKIQNDFERESALDEQYTGE